MYPASAPVQSLYSTATPVYSAAAPVQPAYSAPVASPVMRSNPVSPLAQDQISSSVWKYCLSSLRFAGGTSGCTDSVGCSALPYSAGKTKLN
jgi:hypothetical protein